MTKGNNSPYCVQKKNKRVHLAEKKIRQGERNAVCFQGGVAMKYEMLLYITKMQQSSSWKS